MVAKITNQVSTNIEHELNVKEDKKLQSIQNEEMEAQIEQLQCDLEKMQMYEANYHQIDKKLELAVKKNNEYELDYQNLQYMNNDTIMEMQKLSSELNQAQIHEK